MRPIITIFLLVFAMQTATSQERYLTKSGYISFFSSAPMEDIEANNNQVLSVIDKSNGNMAISILMKSFMFEKALMQEHFNENYVESDKYPKATFKGKIQDFGNFVNASTINVEGTIKIHGVEQKITVPAKVEQSADAILLTGEFFLTLSDFGVSIPKVVAKNIAEKVKVSFKLNHTPYNK